MLSRLSLLPKAGRSLVGCAATTLLLARVLTATNDANLEDPTAKQILDRMAQAYADCKSYKDSGVVKTVFIDASGSRTVEKPFTTALVRPDHFRFEYRETKNERNHFIIWSDGKDVKTWWGIQPGIEKPSSLDLALASATGVSGGSAHTIPALLLPEKITGLKLTAIQDAKRADHGMLKESECFRIEGKFADVPCTLWIDKKSYLVRRIDEQQKFDGFRTEQTIVYDPSLDQEIIDQMLEFDPPNGK